MPRIPLVEDLTHGPIQPGTYILVEFDPSSLWYNAIISIAAGWLKSGGTVSYNVFTRPPDEIRAKLRLLGLDVEQLEREDKLLFWDWYTVTLGRKSKETKRTVSSLKVADLSIEFSKTEIPQPQTPDDLAIADNWSVIGRFNDEKSWIEFELTRGIPNSRQRQITQFSSVMTGIHSEWAYKQLEGASDGIVDLKVEELGGEAKTLMRIRIMRDVGFDSRWHPLKVGENSEVTLEK